MSKLDDKWRPLRLELMLGFGGIIAAMGVLTGLAWGTVYHAIGYGILGLLMGMYCIYIFFLPAQETLYFSLVTLVALFLTHKYFGWQGMALAFGVIFIFLIAYRATQKIQHRHKINNRAGETELFKG